MPDNILGKVGEKVGAEIKTVKDSVTAVANDLANLNVNSITGDLSVTGDVGASTATISGKITAGSLEVQGETKVINTQTVEVSDNILELNKASDGTVTATTSGISINRGLIPASAGKITVTDSSDDGSGGTNPEWGLDDEPITYYLSLGDLSDRTEVTDLNAYLQSVAAGSAFTGLLYEDTNSGNITDGTVLDGKYYVYSRLETSGASDLWVVEVWFRGQDGGNTPAHNWMMTLLEFDDSAWNEHSGSGGYSFDALLQTNDGDQAINATGFQWYDGSSTQNWYPNDVSFTAGVSGGANDKAELLWNNTTSTFETNLGSALTRVKTDGIDVPDGDGVKINTVSIGTYADFESELNTALA